jgi:hypothetical protein
VKLAAAIALLLLAGCGVTQKELDRAVQDQLQVQGRVMGFALDAQLETLELQLALVRRDPKLAAELGKTEAELLKKIDRARSEQRDLALEIKRLRDKYPVEGETP